MEFIGKFNFLYTYFISYTETLLVFITCMFIVNRKDIIIGNKKNSVKILIMVVFLTFIALLIRSVLGQITTIVLITLYVVICIYFFKMHWIEATAGVLLSTISLAAFEYLSIQICNQLVGVTFNGQAIDNRIRIPAEIASRLLQLTLIFVFYKIPIINFGTIKKFSNKTLRKMAFTYIYEAVFIILFLRIGWSQIYNNKLSSTTDTVINIILMCSFIILNIIVLTKLIKNNMLEKKNNTITLLWVKHLLYRYDINKVNEMIDDALKKQDEGREV